MVEVIVDFPNKNGAGRKKVNVIFEGDTLSDLFEKITEGYGRLVEGLFDFDRKIPLDHVNIFINNEMAEKKEFASSEVSSGSEVKILPLIAGGSKNSKLFGFDEDQIKRYSRQIVLPEVGGKGQRKLLDSNVLIVGAGGLGSPAAIYLAAAGVGRIGIVDDDVVELSNLQRQILYGTEDLKDRKVKVAEKRIHDINPEVEVVTYDKCLTPENVFDIFGENWDIILDGTDNFPAKFLINDACVMEGIPFSHGAILRFTGMVTTILPKDGPCYRCFTPTAPPPGLVPSCQEAGVLGVMPGIIGSIQSAEVLKYILGVGGLLKGRIVFLDAQEMEFEEFKHSRRDECPICGKEPKITDLDQVDYGDVCQVRF